MVVGAITRNRRIGDLKNNPSVAIVLGIVAFCAGCTIEQPVDEIFFGTPCPGVQKVKDGGACEKDDNCSAFGKSFEIGRCPKDYNICVSEEDSEDGESYCMKCDFDNGFAVCKGECINTASSNEFCGAKGMCSDTRASDEDYVGENCDVKSDETTRYTCRNGSCQMTECVVGEHEKYDEELDKLGSILSVVCL